MEATETRDWNYALALLIVVSGIFLILRFAGRAFVTIDFEILVIHFPAVICLLIYVAKRYSASVWKPFAGISFQKA